MRFWKYSVIAFVVVGGLSGRTATPIASGAQCSETSLRAYWKFDAIGGTLAPDSSGNGFDGIEYSASPGLSADVPSAGVSPNANSFDFDAGNGEAVEVDRPVENDFTLCAWFKTTGVGGSTEHWVTMSIFHSETGFINNDFGFGVDSNGKLSFGNGDFIDQLDTTFASTASVNTGNWTHGCVTRQKSNGEIKLYVNGQQDGGGTGSDQSLDSNPVMQIGYGTDGAEFFDGNMDEARVYASVLSADEINGIYNGVFTCPVSTSTSSSTDQGVGGSRGRTGNEQILKALQALGAKSSRAAVVSKPVLHTAAPKVLSKVQSVICNRVEKWVGENAARKALINARLEKRFGYTCD